MDFASAPIASVEGRTSLPVDKHQGMLCVAGSCQEIINTKYNTVQFSQCVGFTALPV